MSERAKRTSGSSDYDGILPQRYRAYAYRVLTAASVLVVFYGLLSASEAGLWVAAVGAVLGTGNGLAVLNTAVN